MVVEAARNRQQQAPAAEFIAEIGASLLSATTPMRAVQRLVADLAARCDLHNAVLVLPDAVVVLDGADGSSRRIVSTGAPYRFDQTQQLFRLVDKVRAGDLDPSSGLQQLRAIRAMPPSFGAAARFVGYILVAVGLSMRLNPAPTDFVVSACLGVIIAGLIMASAQRSWLKGLLPTIAAFVAGVPAFVLRDRGVIADPVAVLVPVLATIIPGALLAIGSLDLTEGAAPSGSARLGLAIHQLLLLAFGLVVAGSITRLPDPSAASSSPGLGAWAVPVGVGIYGIGIVLAYSARRRSLPGFLVVIYAAWLGQAIGNALLGGYASGFVGALLAVLVARVVYRWLDGPPEIVTINPLFRILAPGGLGLVGVTQLAVGDFGAIEVGAVVFMFIAVAVGIIVGLEVDRWLRLRLAWW